MLLVCLAGVSQPLAADDIVIGTIRDNPPYVVEQSATGIDNDLIREAFVEAGRQVSFAHAPLIRLPALISDNLVDGIATFAVDTPGCVLSDIFSYWHDGVVVRAEFADRVKSVADLKGLQVGTFPQAEIALGDQLAPYIEGFAKRVIIFKTERVPALLERKRLDAYIGDHWALGYAFRRTTAGRGGEVPYRLVYEFPPTPRRVCFVDESVRDAFNAGLAKLRASGRYEKIISQYIPAK